MIERESVAEVAMKRTSVGGNYCPENTSPGHVTRITTNDADRAGSRGGGYCDRGQRDQDAGGSPSHCEVARVTTRKQQRALGLIAVVITITAVTVRKGVFSKVQFPARSVSASG